MYRPIIYVDNLQPQPNFEPARPMQLSSWFSPPIFSPDRDLRPQYLFPHPFVLATLALCYAVVLPIRLAFISLLAELAAC